MELYTYWRSSAAYRIRIALALKELRYEPRYINLSQGDQRAAAFLKVNPEGLIPVLVDGDLVLTQSVAICEYLEEVYPSPPLLPASPRERAYVRGFAQAIACELHPIQNRRVLDRVEEMGCDRLVWNQYWVESGLGALERKVRDAGTSGAFVFGDAPTIADVFLVPMMKNARRRDCDLSHVPTLAAIDARCQDHPAFRSAAPDRQPDAE